MIAHSVFVIAALMWVATGVEEIVSILRGKLHRSLLLHAFLTAWGIAALVFAVATHPLLKAAAR